MPDVRSFPTEGDPFKLLAQEVASVKSLLDDLRGTVLARATGGSSGGVEVEVGLSSNQSINASTDTLLSFGTEHADPHGWHTGGAPTQLTCPTGREGDFVLLGYVVWLGLTTGTEYRARPYLNASLHAWRPTLYAGGANPTHQPFAVFRNVTAGDDIELAVWHNDAAARSVHSDTRVALVKLS